MYKNWIQNVTGTQIVTSNEMEDNIKMYRKWLLTPPSLEHWLVDVSRKDNAALVSCLHSTMFRYKDLSAIMITQ